MTAAGAIRLWVVGYNLREGEPRYLALVIARRRANSIALREAKLAVGRRIGRDGQYTVGMFDFWVVAVRLADWRMVTDPRHTPWCDVGDHEIPFLAEYVTGRDGWIYCGECGG